MKCLSAFAAVGPHAGAVRMIAEDAQGCLNWEALNTMQINNEQWSSDTLVMQVAALLGRDCVRKPASCKKNMAVENQALSEFEDLRRFGAHWDRAIRDDPECAKYRGFAWEVDVFVQKAETDRSATLHSHPMPLVTLTVPVDSGNAEKVKVPIVKCKKEDSCELEDRKALLRQFLPLATGMAHREQKEEENRIFIVLIPITKNLLEFRRLKRADGQGRDRTAEQWKTLDTLGGRISMWYPYDPVKDGAQRFLEHMEPVTDVERKMEFYENLETQSAKYREPVTDVERKIKFYENLETQSAKYREPVHAVERKNNFLKNLETQSAKSRVG